MTDRRRLLGLIAVLVTLPASSARADDDSTRARDRNVFYAALGVTGAGLVTWVYAGSRVVGAQNDIEKLGPEVAYEQGYTDPDGDGRIADVCALAEGGDGFASQEATSTCKSGKRWQRVGNAAAFVTLGSAVVTAVFAYRAFRSSDADQPAAAPARSAWRAQPIATPTAVGLGVDVDF